jgi:hypothetical protein
MNDSDVLQRVKVRTALGEFTTPGAAALAMDNLMAAGFDRSDLYLLARTEGPGGGWQEYVTPEDTAGVFAVCVGVACGIGALLGALIGIRASGTTLWIVIDTILFGAMGFGLGVLIAPQFGWHWRQANTAIPDRFVLCVRIPSDEQEQTARRILESNGAARVDVAAIEVEKRLQDLPLSSLRIDPWLGDEPLGRP